VQRIYVERGVYDAFVQAFVAKVEALKVGDPGDDDTDVGPVIDEDSRIRVLAWIEEAQSAGAKLLTGGEEGRLIRPTVLAEVPDAAKVSCDEVFGPVVIVNPVDSIDEALERANGTRFGLQAGVFTASIDTALHAADVLEFGGVIVNEVPAYRTDQMPYGGVKASGNTKEGPAYAVREMTEERLVVIQR
jgi:acyl-CoA reductase-like NAD-dependent aldehyde dehydrogenase